MYIKLTLVGLLIILCIVVIMTYSVNKEGFDTITNGYYKTLSTNLPSALSTVSPSPSITSSATPSSSPTESTSMQIPATGTPVIPATGTPIIPATATTPSATATIAPSSIPQRTDVVPEISISGSGYDALTLQKRMELLKDIQKVVRNEILSNRSTMPILSGETRKSKDTDSTAQGQEYESSCHKDTDYRCPKNPDGSCPPVPDMSEYIKKDAIPCWNCALDY